MCWEIPKLITGLFQIVYQVQIVIIVTLIFNLNRITRPLNQGHKTAGLCSFVANFSLLFCAVYGKR